MRNRSRVTTSLAAGLICLLSACGNSSQSPTEAATSSLPSSSTASTTIPTTTTAPDPPPEKAIPGFVVAELDDSLILRTPVDLGAADEARWLFEQLPVQRLLVDQGDDGNVVFAIDDGVLTEIETTGFVSSDGPYVFIGQSTAADERTQVVEFDGTAVCDIPARASRIADTASDGLVIEAAIQVASENQRLVYWHSYDVDCSTGEFREIEPVHLIPSTNAWQERYRLARVGDREFFLKTVSNSSPTTNEDGVRVDGSDQTSWHRFNDDGSRLVHVSRTLVDPTTPRVQMRQTVAGELQWEVVVNGEVGQLDIVDGIVLIDAADNAGFDGLLVVDLETGELSAAVETGLQIRGSS